MDYWHKAWTCPFFKWDEKQRTACEGGCQIVFPDRESAVQFHKKYCASDNGWKGCCIAAALLDYYDRKEENDNGKEDQG